MARIHEKTRSSRVSKQPYTCTKCHKTIDPGQKYYEWTLYHAAPRRRHVACGRPAQSEMTNSKMSAAYSAIEGLEEALAAAHKAKSLDGLESDFDDAISELEQVRDEYQESLDNMGENLAQGDTGQEMQQKIDDIESYVQGLEGAKDEISSAKSEVAEAIAEEPEGTEPGDADEEDGHDDSQPEQDNAVETCLDSLDTIVGDYGF